MQTGAFVPQQPTYSKYTIQNLRNMKFYRKLSSVLKLHLHSPGRRYKNFRQMWHIEFCACRNKIGITPLANKKRVKANQLELDQKKAVRKKGVVFSCEALRQQAKQGRYIRLVLVN